MTDASTSTPETDVAYLKRLAQAGRGAPAPFLMLMAVFGGAYGLSFLSIGLMIHLWGIETFTTDEQTLPIMLLASTPLISHGLFLLALLWTAWRTFGPNRIKLSRVAVTVWSGAFVAFMTTVTAFNLYSGGEPGTDQVYTAYMMPPVLLVLWGCAWWVTAILSERRWLMIVAVASFVAAIAMAAIGNTPALLFAAAACLLLLAFLPAVLLMRERRA